MPVVCPETTVLPLIKRAEYDDAIRQTRDDRSGAVGHRGAAATAPRHPIASWPNAGGEVPSAAAKREASLRSVAVRRKPVDLARIKPGILTGRQDCLSASLNSGSGEAPWRVIFGLANSNGQLPAP